MKSKARWVFFLFYNNNENLEINFNCCPYNHPSLERITFLQFITNFPSLNSPSWSGVLTHSTTLMEEVSLVNYLTTETKQGPVVKLWYGSLKEIWRKYYQKLKYYIEGTTHTMLVIMYLPNSQIGVLLRSSAQQEIMRRGGHSKGSSSV